MKTRLEQWFEDCFRNDFGKHTIRRSFSINAIKKTEFDQWFEESFDEKSLDEESLRSIAKKAWDEALNRGAKYGKEIEAAKKCANKCFCQYQIASSDNSVILCKLSPEISNCVHRKIVEVPVCVHREFVNKLFDKLEAI